ncbi:MAG: hypothetical protein RLZZ628_88 [Bacteroidota bacterium]|jgi:hypothetical protein
MESFERLFSFFVLQYKYMCIFLINANKKYLIFYFFLNLVLSTKNEIFAFGIAYFLILILVT